MLFDINNTNYKYREQFDEFPDIENHTFQFTRCTCGSIESTVISTVSRHRNFLPIVACEKCGTLRANPYFTAETAAHYYGNVYGNVKREDRSPEQLFSEQRRKSIAPFLEDLAEEFQSVLDFGGGAGGRTAEFMEKGKTVSLHEVEGNYSRYAYDQGIQPHDEAMRYDLVVVSHVIEHMIDPVSEMRDVIEKCCAPNGLLLVATPIIDHQRARQWLQHFHIAHKYYFTEGALVGMMAALGCRLVKQNGVDAYVFRVGAPVDPAETERLYRAGAAMTKAAIEKDLKPTWQRLLDFVKFWRPQPHNQAAPRTPELSP